jgi:predicted glutamine amidotransferase
MCRLLGLVANKEVDLEFSLERFKELSNKNPDGWGIGWYENDSPQIFKQDISAKDKESQLHILSKEVRSNIIMAHLRKGTEALPSEENSHPFQYKDWLFAHNGSVDRKHLLSLLRNEYKDKLKGKTDSEVYFYWILQNIEDCNDTINGIKEAIDKIIITKYSGLNFLLSNGKILYAFRYSGKSKTYYSLFKLERKPSSPGPLELLSKETKALIHSKSLNSENAFLVCSEKLTEENWMEIDFGNLLEIGADLKTRELSIV